MAYYSIIAPSSYKSPDVANGLMALASVSSGVEFRIGDSLFLLMYEVLLRHRRLLSCVLRCLDRIWAAASTFIRFLVVLRSTSS